MSEENNIVKESTTGNILRIGKPSPTGYINMFCNWNPFKKMRFVQVLNNSKIVEVTSVQNYENGTGGIAVKMINFSYNAVVECISEIFETEVP